MLEASLCRARQQRLLRLMYAKNLGAVVLGWRSHAYYLTGHWPFWQHEAAAIVFSDGKTVLVCAKEPDEKATADEAIAYDSTWFSTQRQDQGALAGQKVIEALAARRARRIGVDTSGVSSAVAMQFDGELVCVDSEIYQLRRKKDPDELKLMRHAIDCTKAMYARAREVIEPGVSELQVYGELYEAATLVAQEPLTAHLGNDYACAQRGGPPRKDHAANAGELYILDLGPPVKGYFSDNARTFSVDRKPTDAQRKAWDIVTGIFPIVEKMARPGTKCRDIFAAADDYYRSKTGKDFPHHLGHGVGLQPHEFPHLNPKWDDVLMEGEVFTCEPGVYGDDLRAGIRIENQYLVTADGVENLTPFGMEMD